MMLFAKQLSDHDVAAVAAYYQSLEPAATAGGSP
jgi:cytochrome c553